MVVASSRLWPRVSGSQHAVAKHARQKSAKIQKVSSPMCEKSSGGKKPMTVLPTQLAAVVRPAAFERYLRGKISAQYTQTTAPATSTAHEELQYRDGGQATRAHLHGWAFG